jgi:WD40 repeat protein
MNKNLILHGLLKNKGSAEELNINGQEIVTGILQGTVNAFDTVYVDILKQMQKLPDLATSPGSNSLGASFSPDGVYLAVAHVDSPFITIYKRSGDTFTKLANPAILPTGVGYYAEFSNSGLYLAVSHNTSPWITIYKRSGDTFTKLANPATLPTGYTISVTFSSDDVYLACGHNITPWLTIYKRSSDTFTKLANPASLPVSQVEGVSFNPSVSHLAVTVNSVVEPLIIYKRTNDVFAKLATPSNVPGEIARKCKFSPDGKILVVCHSSIDHIISSYNVEGDIFTKFDFNFMPNKPDVSGWEPAFSKCGNFLALSVAGAIRVLLYKIESNNLYKQNDPLILPGNGTRALCFSPGSEYLGVGFSSSPNFNIYKLDNLTKLGDPDIVSLYNSIGGIGITPDSKYIIFGNGYGVPYIHIYKMENDIVKMVPDAPLIKPAGASNGVSISPDGIYTAISHSVSPFITIYKRDGDTFTKLANPDVLPTSNGWDISFSPCGNYLGISHSASPFMTIYKRNGDIFTKLANPATLPSSTGDGRGISLSPDGVYLSVATNNYPYFSIYKRELDTLTKLADPAILPSSSGFSVSFSKCGMYLAVGNHMNPTSLALYKRNGDIFTKLANPTIMPSTHVKKVRFSPDGHILTVSLSTSPFLFRYRREGDNFIKLNDLEPLAQEPGGIDFSKDGDYMLINHYNRPNLTIYKSAITGISLANNKTIPKKLGYTKQSGNAGDTIEVVSLFK